MPNPPAPSLHAVVLAAGASSRFGSAKQLARFEGQTLLQRVLRSVHEIAVAEITVVLGAHAAEISASLPRSRATILVNRDWSEGIASSLRLAVSALPGSCAGVMVLLADQPMVRTAALQLLASAWRSQPRHLVASRYAGTLGAPAIFPRWCFSELGELRGDSGARALLSRHADKLVAVDNPEAAIDIDIPEDLLGLS